MPQWGYLAVAGGVAGLVAGAFGVGGGFLLVPVLVRLGHTQHSAHAHSLGTIIPISAVASTTYAANSSVDWGIAIAFSLTAVIGAGAGALAMPRLQARWLRWLFLLLLLALLARSIPWPGVSSDLTDVAVPLVLSAGLLAGLLGGVLGVGGGFVMVPAGVLAGLTQHVAQGTSLIAMAAAATVGSLVFKRGGYQTTKSMAPLGAGAALGSLGGALLGLALDAVFLRAAFIGLLASVLLYSAGKEMAAFRCSSQR